MTSDSPLCANCHIKFNPPGYKTITAGRFTMPICSESCFRYFNVTAAHPLKDIPLTPNSRDINTFVTNIGFVFECYSDPVRFSNTFGSLFIIITRSGCNLERYLGLEPDADRVDRDRADLKWAHDILNSYPELKVHGKKRSPEPAGSGDSIEPTTPIEAKSDRGDPPSPELSDTKTSHEINGTWNDNKAHVVHFQLADITEEHEGPTVGDFTQPTLPPSEFQIPSAYKK